MKLYNLASMNIDYVYAVDHFVAAGETLSSEHMEMFPGGKGLNQSVALAKAGVRVIHGGKVGDGGGFLLDTLSAAGADISRVEQCRGSCGHAMIQVDKKGQNCILLFAGTNHQIDRAYIERFLSDAEAGDILLLQNEISHLDTAFQIAAEKHMQIAFNPSPFHEDIKKLPLSCVKWWFCNEVESEALFGSSEPDAVAEAFAGQYPDSNLILTLGKDGSVFISRDTYLTQPIYPVCAVDTTAAGDTFAGYFLAAVMNGENIAASLDAAARASSITVSRPGASASIPRRDEVYKNL